jgi:hypothetical protein
MFEHFLRRVHPHGVFFNEIQSAFLSTSALLITLLGLLILFICIYVQMT